MSNRTVIEFNCAHKKCRRQYSEDTAEPDHFRAYRRAKLTVERAGWKVINTDALCPVHKK